MMRDDEIFAEAIDMAHGERTAYLDRVCAGDAALRARVESLLRGHDAAASFLEQSPVERPAALAEESVGDAFGNYTLVRKIGEGGYGVVYLAEQREPVRRHVALKIIKLGMDTRQVILRFEAERQALALMDHPDIARVFDAGATATGRPYFVMEFVDGTPITKFCDEHGLPVAARLELFARVCVALQHAHQKGIIHRDLKPSNILVTMRDSVPMPKIIDFGIAKATRGRLTDQTLVTAVEQFIGTPAYMSPEQAELRDLDIDTRSDIYSLGVLLYELLAGRPPYDPQSLVRAGLDEIRRIIREVEPARPSTRVSTLDNADRATVARLRGLAPMRLTAVLRGDLDWIVMRCLEKDRERRYGTAHELADDVRRHLRLEPVVARPPDALYRLRKFVARNRLACASAALVALSLVGATIVSNRQAARARRAEGVAQAERADAQRRQEQAESLLAFMLGDFRTELKKLGQLKLLDAVGEKAMAYFASANARDLTDAALTRQVKALTQIGETRIEQARYPEADAAFGAALSRAAELTNRRPRDADMLFERAQVEYWIGFVHLKRGNFPAAGEWFTRYRDSAAALVGIDGTSLRARRELVSGHHNLAVLDVTRGDLAAARKGFLAEMAALQKLAAENPTDRQLKFRITDVDSWLGNVADRAGDFSEAVARFSAQTAGLDELVRLEPQTAHWRFKLADSLAWEVDVLAITGQPGQARTRLARAEGLLRALVEQDSGNRRWLLSLLDLRLKEAAIALGAGDAARAAEVVADTLPRLVRLVAAEPQDRVFASRLMAAWRLEARSRVATGRGTAAEAAANALAVGEPLIRDARADDRALGEYAMACVTAGAIARAAGQTAEAERHWTRALGVLGERTANSTYWRLLDPAARALAALGRTDESRTVQERLRRYGYQSTEP